MSAAPSHLPATIKVLRAAYAGLAAALLASAVALIVVGDATWWQTVAFALGPTSRCSTESRRGSPAGNSTRAPCRSNNALHRFRGPLALAIAALAAGLPLGYLAGASAWGFHVAFDRAIGLRPRSPDGFQRAEGW